MSGHDGGSVADPGSITDWACRISERLPASDVRRLAQAAVAGEPGVRRLRAAAGSAILRDACDQLRRRLADSEPLYVSGLLSGAAHAVSRAHQHQSVAVVWTGPESRVSSSRLTAATVIDLINEARSEILLVSYATQTEPSISVALSAAVARGVTVTLLAERNADNPSYTSSLPVPFPSVEAVRLHWPLIQRPSGAALHAKIIVVDDSLALVGSANLTSRAMESNLECGILIRGGSQPKAIRDHIASLCASGNLRQL